MPSNTPVPPKKKYRFADETVEQREKRLAGFKADTSDFFDPGVLANLGVGEDEAEQFHETARRWYDEDVRADQQEGGKRPYSFHEWAHGMASSLSKVDPKSEAGAALNPVRMAELMREITRIGERSQTAAERQYYRERSQTTTSGKQANWLDKAAAGVFEGARSFADTASGGGSEMLATGLNRLVGGEEGAKRYQQAAADQEAMVNAGPSSGRFARGFGGLLGFISPAGGMSKVANGWRLGLEAGKKGLATSGWRYGMNRAVAVGLGGTQGMGAGARWLGSIGNFAATEFALTTARAINEAMADKMAGGDAALKFAQIMEGDEMTGEGGLGLNTLQGGTSGALMPVLQRLGKAVSSRLAGGSGFQNRMWKTLREMPNLKDRIQAVLARSAGGAVEFSAFSLLPDLHNPNGPFGVVDDFALMFGEDSPERDAALERMLFHIMNGGLLKNLPGHGTIEPNTKQRAQLFAGGIDRAGIDAARVDALRADEEGQNRYHPSQELVERLRQPRQPELTPEDQAAGKDRRTEPTETDVGRFVIESAGRQILGARTENMEVKDILDAMPPEFRESVATAITEAENMIRDTGGSVEVRFSPDVGVQVHPVGAERGAMSPREATAMRQAIKEIVGSAEGEEKDAVAANIIMQQAVIEGAARMGGAAGAEDGAVSKVLRGIAEDAVETAKTGGKQTPEQGVRLLDIEIADRMEKAEALANEGRAEEAAALGQEIQALESQKAELLRPEQEKAAAAEQKAAVPGSETKPLTPGDAPKERKGRNTGTLAFPEGFAKRANGEEVRVQVGKVGTGDGLFRRAQVLATDELGGEMVVRTADGQHFTVTPEDIIAGRVRGALFKGLQKPDATGKSPRFDTTGLTRDANDTVEPMKPAADPEARITDQGMFPFGREAMLPGGQTSIVDTGEPQAKPKQPRRLGGRGSKPSSGPPAAGAPPVKPSGPPKPAAPSGAKPSPTPVPASEKISGQAPWAPTAPGTAPEKQAPPPASREPRRLGGRRPKTATDIISQQNRIIQRGKKRIEEERQTANTDAQTGVSNKRAFQGALKRLQVENSNADEASRTLRGNRMIGAFDATSLGLVNNNRGEPVGDAYLVEVANRLREIAKKHGIEERDIFRTGGDEFKIIGTADQIKAIGRELSEITSERGSLGEIDLPEGKIVKRILAGVGSTLKDATDALNRVKSQFAAEGKRQGWLSKDRDPSKGWKPSAKSGAVASETTGLPSPEVKTGSAAPLYSRVEGRPNEVVVRNLPKGFTVANVVRSGRHHTVIIRDNEGNRFILRKNGGYHAVPADFKEPEPTKNAHAVDADGNTLYRGPLSMPDVKPQPAPKGVSTGGLETREQAEARLGSFRRAKLVDEQGVQIASDDPVRRAYIAAGAIAARESVTATDVKDQINTLTQRRNKMVDEKGEDSPEVARIDGALSALHSVHRAKTFIEELDKKIKWEHDAKERSALTTNPASGLEFTDASMGTAQRTARDLGQQYVAWIDSKLEQVKGRRNVRDLSGNDRTLYERLSEQRKIAQSILESSPFAKSHGTVRTAEERLPEMRIGDVVQVVHGGRDAPHTFTGLVVGGGDPSGASLKRGRGAMGWRYRRALKRAERGETLTVGEKELLRSAERFPGKWVSMFTREGNLVRVRLTDITEIGPDKMTDQTFSGKGSEVTERRLLSWLTPPEELAHTRNPRGTGSEEESANRTKMLLAGEQDGYMVVVRKQEGGKEIVEDAREIEPVEAARIEAKVRGSRVVNGTATSDMYRLEAAAVLAPPEFRKGISTKERVRLEPGVFGKAEVPGVPGLKEESAPDRWFNPFTGLWEAQPTFRYTPRYYDPKIELRKPSELNADERVEYDNWMRLAEEREAQEIASEQRSETYDETRKELTPLHINEEKGEWLFLHRLRGEGGTLRDGRVVLGERTPEGTILTRYISSNELRDYLNDNGLNNKWEEWKENTYTERRRMTAENNRMVANARGNGILREYMQLLENQLEQILKTDGKATFLHEGDLHAATRKWLKDNPPPAKDSKEYDAWVRQAENFLFQSPRVDRNLKPAKGEVTEEGVESFDVQDTAFLGETKQEAGPLWLAAERVRGWRNPSSGERFRVTDQGTVEYENPDAASRDFYVAEQQRRTGTTLGIFGMGMMPGGAWRAIRQMVGSGFGAVDAGIRGYHWLSRIPAKLWTDVSDGVTDLTKNVTDMVLFDRLHDVLYNPNVGAPGVGATRKSMVDRLKAAGKEMGRLFGDPATSADMRLYLNDYHGSLGVLKGRAQKALAPFSKLPIEKQMDLLRQFERGNTPAILQEYRDIMDSFGDQLVKDGLLHEDQVKKWKGKYIHYGRWVWTKENIDKAIENQRKYIEELHRSGDRGAMSDALESMRVLERVKKQVGLTRSRVYIGDHPIDKIDRRQIQEFHRKGFARFKGHETLDEAIKAGLDVSQPHMLLIDGILGEGKALAQNAFHKAILADKGIVRKTEDAPGDWVHIVGTRYANDPVWKDAIGKSIEPQAYDLLEATRPDHNGIRQTWDMLHGLIKQGMTVGNLANYHTQLLGNLYTLASRVPFFQLPTRFMRAILTLAGIGEGAKERRDKYDRWNWTRMAGDAIREIADILDKGNWTTGAEARTENPYAGMGISETLGEAFRRLFSKKFLSGVAGLANAAREGFQSLDAIARIALHEVNMERGMSEIDSRKDVDSLFDMRHLPRGWQGMRRYVDSFASIKAVMGRNMHRLAPAAPATMTNLAMFSAMFNMVMRSIYGVTEDEADELIDASIPKNNAFSEYVGKHTALLMPDGEGRLRVVDMNRFSPTDVGARAIPGARSLTSGLENMAMEGKWAGDHRGAGINQELANLAASNVFYGPTLDWVFDRDRFSEGRGVREEFQNPGAFGSTGFLRFMIERGPLPGAISALLPPGMRESAATFVPSGARAARRFGETSREGALGTPPRTSIGTDEKGKTLIEQQGRGRLIMDMLGFRFEEPNQYRRVMEQAARREDNTIAGKRGLAPEKGLDTDDRLAAKQTVKDVQGLATVQRAMRLVGMTRIARYNEKAREAVLPLIQKTVGSHEALKSMIRSLRLMDEDALAGELQQFFSQDVNRDVIPRPDRPGERMNRGRFGSQRAK